MHGFGGAALWGTKGSLGFLPLLESAYSRMRQAHIGLSLFLPARYARRDAIRGEMHLVASILASGKRRVCTGGQTSTNSQLMFVN